MNNIFHSTGIQGYELKYPNIDKKSYVVYKPVKHFRPYILKSHVKVTVPHPTVRSLFVQKELREGRCNWMTLLQEYDLEFKLRDTIKGLKLCKIAT